MSNRSLTLQVHPMSLHSNARRPPARWRIASSAALVLALAAAPALAQTRTPTSPLDAPQPDVPPAPSTAPVPAATPAPTPTSTPRLNVELPGIPPASDLPPIDLDALLPEGLSTSGGLTPEAATQRASVVARRLRRAEARERAADAGLAAARRAFVPSVSASARYTRLSDYTPGTIPFFDTAGCLQDIPGCTADPTTFQRNVILQQPILDQYAMRGSVAVPLSEYVGGRRYDLEAARAQASAAAESTRAARSDVQLDAAAAYWELLRARAQTRLADDALEVATRRATEMRARAASGLATEAQVREAEAHQAAYERLREVASSRVQIAERALRDQLDLGDEEIVLTASLARLPVNPSSDGDALRDEARTSSPDVAASARLADAAEARARAESARRAPTVSATFNVDYANPNSRIFPQQTVFTTTWDAGVSIGWSLDSVLVGSARTAQARANAEDARLAAEETELNVGRNALEARAALVASLAAVQSQTAAVRSAESRTRQVNERTRAGLATETERLDADASFLRARLDLIDALVDAQLAEARLSRVLGRTPDSETQNSRSEVR